jgi:hypothetical protein
LTKFFLKKSRFSPKIRHFSKKKCSKRAFFVVFDLKTGSNLPL